MCKDKIMSRCMLGNMEEGTGVVIGWDPGMETFFVQVHNYQLPERESIVLWTGGVDGRIHDVPDELINLIRPHAAKHDAQTLRDELMKDKAANDGDRCYGFGDDGALEDEEDRADDPMGDALPIMPTVRRPQTLHRPRAYSPDIFRDDMPKAAGTAVAHIEGRLRDVAGYVADFAEALDLFDFVPPEKHPWKLIAAKDGALCIYHFFRTLRAIDANLRQGCPELLALLPNSCFKRAAELRRAHFKNYEQVRDGVGHVADLVATRQDFQRNSFTPGVLALPSVKGRTFSMSVKGEMVSYDISGQTLAVLIQIQDAIFDGFEEASKKLRNRHWARLRARE
jgi:hypothetical protein